MEEEALSAERALLGRESQIAGVVRLTTPEAFGNGFMAPLAARLRLEQPEILLELVAANARLSLTKREADLAIRTGRPQQALLVMRRMGELADGLYASRAYLDRRGRPGADLAGHDYIDYDDVYLGQAEIAWLRQVARNGRCALRVIGTHGMFGGITAGLGIGVLPCWMGDSTEGLERVLPAERYASDLWMVLHRDLRHVARIRVVAEFLVREMRAAAARLAGRPERRSRRSP
jgi:DNA-binding transcriptional LysR family regulator